ncbi:TonB-dependent receptor [Marinifilum caeruleilacunae]|uniref:TonB-dependent receptor n=1 Tax=Marinifilum caeruleilacunae TaxID=2499076 RepID=A0ABX1WYM3_9BACT|nr:TonB-dependent receptor [Marinifilum caeruleilacunae]NOU61243.1 TonB-dependent receptor [Marinifilum caeruleilacunae]
MKKSLKLCLSVALMVLSFVSVAQEKRTDANIYGHVIADGEHLPFATISIEGTTIGTAADETGHFQIVNLPLGSLKIKAQAIGYKSQVVTVEFKKGESKEVHFDLEKDVLGIDEVVVTGDRNEKNRTESSTIVNTLTPKLFTTTQSVTLSESLNFAPGLRMENNCQNCGFTQVRMNGMEGPYSQVLINSRPIFSGLAGVYGLELMPANMIERVEVVRGGGSALYGSNAIAGTINLILKDPVNNSYEFSAGTGFVGVGVDGAGDAAEDYTASMNTSLVSSDGKTGLAVYGFYRDRAPFDANDDTFSEISSLQNTTVGSRLFHRFSARSKVAVDFFNIKENRRGGDKHSYVEHEAGIAEALEHDITTAAVTYDQFFREKDLWSVYVSGQRVDRDSYYGAEQSLADYGNTKGLTYTLGSQYNAHFENSNLVFGMEHVGETLKDKKLGYLDVDNATVNGEGEIVIPHTDNTIVADQEKNTFGLFTQYEMDFNRLSVSVGARFDRYSVKDKDHGDKETGNVLSPRVTLKYDIKEHLQARASYSKGYRAPQIFDEDLHIETSGSRKVLHENSDDLEQETSHSYMASLDFNKKIGNTFVGFLVEGFYTKLDNPFANEYGEADANGTVIYTRVNATEGAVVKGLNMEFNVVPSDKLSLKGGFTIQSSKYEEAQNFGQKDFFRTPNEYGYFAIDWKPTKNFGFSTTGNYTGPMNVEFFGVSLPDPDAGTFIKSDSFFDLGMKFRYNIKLNGAKLQLYTGMKNIFNSYQDDFDSGVERDPGFIYGPLNPRTIYFGIKIGNLL